MLQVIETIILHLSFSLAVKYLISELRFVRKGENWEPDGIVVWFSKVNIKDSGVYVYYILYFTLFGLNLDQYSETFKVHSLCGRKWVLMLFLCLIR